MQVICQYANTILNECQFQIQVCKIVPRQCYQKKLEGNQVSTLRKEVNLHPA